MSRRILLFIASFALVSPVRAQAAVTVGAGVTAPDGPLAEIDQIGYHVTTGLDVTPQLTSVGFRIDASLHALSRAETIQHITERFVALSVAAVFYPPQRNGLKPYVIAGIGAYNQSTSPRPVASSSSTDIGFNVGGGLKFNIVGLRAFSEFRYHKVMVDTGPRFLPITFGVIF